MGNKTNGQIDPTLQPKIKTNEVITRSSFEFIAIIGRGGFCHVWKVYHKKTKKLFAMKEMSKTKIIDKKSQKSVKSERNLLSKMNHPFIINMQYCFQDNEHLYLAMDLLTGGDLRYQTFHYTRFTEEQTRFFFACMLLSLEYCHVNHIIHRDIKPENLVLDDKGYVHLTDFGIAKIEISGNGKETSGTPGYMSPEVMCGKDHTIAVDYFALGVIGFEFMTGKRPYLGQSRKEIKEKIMAKQIQIDKTNIPNGWTIEAVDCINRLLQRKPMKRLGYNGAQEVKMHPWFKYYDWKELYLRKIEAPFIPKQGDNYEYKYCNQSDKPDQNTLQRYEKILLSEDYPTAFADYYYFNRNLLNKGIGPIEETMKNPHLIFEIENDIEIEKKNSHSRNTNNNSKKSIQSLSKIDPINYSLNLQQKKKNAEILMIDNNNNKDDINRKEGITCQEFYSQNNLSANSQHTRNSQLSMKQIASNQKLMNVSLKKNTNSNYVNNNNVNKLVNTSINTNSNNRKLSIQQRNYSSNSTNLNSIK